MGEEIQKVEAAAKRDWLVIMSWVGGISALIGLFASIAGGVNWYRNHRSQHTELQGKMALAQTQAKEGEYQASIQSYGDILKTDPLYGAALDQQLATTMLWVEDFHIAARDDQNAAELAAPALDQIMAILDAGLTRSKGPQAADVQAHIGWAHWLNQHIAEREFGPAAEQNLRAALIADPSNVYGNAMLGNWMLQNGGSLTDALQHFKTADATGKARPFVRSLELGGLIHLDKKGARAAIVRVANEMRKSGEPMDEGYKSRITGFCFDPAVTDRDELAESLGAVPADDAWQTYLWLNDNPDNSASHALVREFIQANLLEVSGKRSEALQKFRTLQADEKEQSSSLKASTDAAIARLSRN